MSKNPNWAIPALGIEGVIGSFVGSTVLVVFASKISVGVGQEPA